MSENYNASLTNFEDGASRAHLARYYLARGFVTKNDVVLDICCGTGYGTELLAPLSRLVYGYDRDEAAIAIARKRELKNASFTLEDVDTITDIPHSHVTVCLETLEHLVNPERLLGLLRASTSRFIVYSVPIGEEVGANPYHRQTFSPGKIESLVCQQGWRPFHSFSQGNHYIGVAYRGGK